MQLTEEEVSIIEDFRHKTAVHRAFNEGIATATTLAYNYLTEKHVNHDYIKEMVELTDKALKGLPNG